MTVKFSSLAACASIALLCSASAAAYADGMPFGVTPPSSSSSAIPDTPDNTNAMDATGSANASGDIGAGSAQAAGTRQPTAAQLPKPLPPQPSSSVVEVQPNTSFFGLSVGEYDPFRHSDRATSFNAEVQPGVRIVGVLQPLFGAMVTTKGSALAYAGVGVPFHITQHVFLMPSAALGVYKHGGGYDLGRTVVERLGAELAYQFDDKSRLGLNFDVLTNGTSVQSHDRTEMVALTYTMPFDMLSGLSSHDMGDDNATGGDQPAAAPMGATDTQAAPASSGTIAPASETITIAPASGTTTIAPAPAAHAAAPSTALSPSEVSTHAFP